MSHAYLPTSNYVLHFIKILSRSINVKDHKFRIAHIMRKDIVEVLKEIKEVRVVPDLSRTDAVLVDMDSLDNLFTNFIKEIDNHTLLVILDIIANINQRPELLKELGSAGFTKSILPVNGGIAISIKRGYNVEFFRKTVKVYRESFIHGPNPVDYNTAIALYILAKFVLARRRGVIVEVGTGRGFSTLWLAHAAKETSSRVISIDNKCDRVDYTKNVLKSLNLGDYAEILCTDAKSLEPYLLPGALILAHNTPSDAHVIKPYIEKVYKKPYKSITITTDSKGLTISVYMHQ